MKKLNLHQVEERLLTLNIKIFTPQDLKVMFTANQRAVEGFLHYNVKKGAFVRLRKGLYSLKRNLPHDFFLANKIYSPSYISLDTALSYYNLIPESIYSLTSITTKPTREFTVVGRLFEYHKIKRQAYTGYIPKAIRGEIVYLATPEKALVDFLYFVFLGKRSLNERLKLDNIDTTQLGKYVRLSGQKRFVHFLNQILKRYA